MNNSSSTGCTNISLSVDQTFIPVLYGCVFCVGLPTNCLALYGLYRLVKADYALPIYAINLLLADLLQIATLPLWIDYYHGGHEWHFGKAACKVIGCSFYISLFVSIFFMCCISLERYLAIVHPLFFQTQRALWKVCVLCLAVWLFFIGGVVSGFNMGFESESPNTFCMEAFPAKTEFAIFQLVSIPFTFLVPLLFLVFVSLRVRRSLARSVSVPKREKTRITGLLLLIVFMFLLIFGPYHFIRAVRYTGIIMVQDACGFESRLFLYFQISLGVLSVNSLLDPVMYIFICRDARKEVLDSFPCIWRIVGVTDDSNTPSTAQAEIEPCRVSVSANHQ